MTSLKATLLINATSCLVFGALFLIAPALVSEYLGEVPNLAVQILGIVLIVNSVHLSFAAQRPSPYKLEIIWFSLGDFAWWLLTLGLIATGHWITTSNGVIVAAIIATGVAYLGILQLWRLGTQRTSRSSAQHFVAIGTSWMALPLWVKLWLVLLNGSFLWAFFYWPDDLAKITLIAFVATGPLLAGQLAYDGGLRRILGLAHLVPWAPLLVWLIWLHGLELGAYAQVLAIVLTICLTFDAYDLIRFWRGDRAIIGQVSPIHLSKQSQSVSK